MRRRPTTIRSWLGTGAPQHSRAGDAPTTGDRARFGSAPAARLDLVPMRLRRFPAVLERTGLSRSTIWRFERRGTFPKQPTYLGECRRLARAHLCDPHGGRPRRQARRMTGEQLGVGAEPRHGTDYVSAWIKALESDPKEIRAAAVDVQGSTDWLLARGRSREDDKAAPERPDGGVGQTREPRDPDRPRAWCRR